MSFSEYCVSSLDPLFSANLCPLVISVLSEAKLFNSADIDDFNSFDSLRSNRIGGSISVSVTKSYLANKIDHVLSIILLIIVEFNTSHNDGQLTNAGMLDHTGVFVTNCPRHFPNITSRSCDSLSSSIMLLSISNGRHLVISPKRVFQYVLKTSICFLCMVCWACCVAISGVLYFYFYLYIFCRYGIYDISLVYHRFFSLTLLSPLYTLTLCVVVAFFCLSICIRCAECTLLITPDPCQGVITVS